MRCFIADGLVGESRAHGCRFTLPGRGWAIKMWVLSGIGGAISWVTLPKPPGRVAVGRMCSTHQTSPRRGIAFAELSGWFGSGEWGSLRRSQKPDSSAEGLQRVFEPPRAEHIRPTPGSLRQPFSPSPARFLALPRANGIHVPIASPVFSAVAPKSHGWNLWEFGQIPGNEPIFLVRGG